MQQTQLMDERRTHHRPRVLTWHLHGTYLYYLSQVDCEFILPVNENRDRGYGGRIGPFPWGDNVREVALEDLRNTDFDLILFQTPQHYLHDQYTVLTEAQRQLPKIYLEHDPPRQHPTDTRHVVDDPTVTVVHVTDFNRLMWDNGAAPTRTIDHGVVDPGMRYRGTKARGIVVINNLKSRGRRLGWDIFEQVREQVPIDLIGMGSKEIGGLGEVPHNELPDFIADYRFFFNPIRYTSMGLAVIEAMLVGLPIVAMQTTELVTVIRSGENGYLSLDPDHLAGDMRHLLDDPQHARQLGEAARSTAIQRFSLDRFKQEWLALFTRLTAPVS